MLQLIRRLVPLGVLLLHLLVAMVLLQSGVARPPAAPVIAYIYLASLHSEPRAPEPLRRHRHDSSARLRSVRANARVISPAPVTVNTITTPMPHQPLDLHVPEQFLDTASKPTGPGWVFDQRLVKVLEDARRQRHKRDQLASRRRARNGLTAQEYARPSAQGENVKTDTGCFDLREDPFNHRPRWWAQACTDTHQSPWDQTPLPD